MSDLMTIKNTEIAKYEEQSFKLQKLIDSKTLPAHIKTVEQAFLIEEMGRELGFPTLQAFHNIIPIQGKLTLTTKAIGALMRKHKIGMQTLEDCTYVYPDGTVRQLHSGDIQPVDRRTLIKFTRHGIEEDVAYYWSDAMSAGYAKKDNWVRMPREMMYSRCLTKGANRIAQDITMGLYSADEMFDVLDNGRMKVTRDDEGFIKSVEDVSYTDETNSIK